MPRSVPDCVLGNIRVGAPEAERPGGEGRDTLDDKYTLDTAVMCGVIIR